jgi:glycosyltransferase involved in cell wall biosynthesis
MRIGLDGTPLTVAADGTARYTAQLSRALAVEFPEDEILLLSDQPFAAPADAPGNLRMGGAPRNWMERRWWSFGIAREMSRRRVDVFHGTGFSVPYIPIRPSVLSVHDLSPWLDPAWHHAADRVRRRTPLLARLGLATMVLTDTEAIRRAVAAHFRLPPDRVAAVPLAAAGAFRQLAGPPERTPYFLCTGAIEPRKNLPMLVDAWREVARETAVELVLVGRRRADGPRLEPEPGLRLMGEVDDEELARLYNGALALMYPSLYEGFGLPVVEAMSCGAAVVASRDPALVEVCGGAAMHVEAGDARGWAAAMRALAAKPELAAAWRERGLERARQFSWVRTARMTREVYAEARRRFGA